MLATIRATRQAIDLMALLQMEHGPLSFHYEGGTSGALSCLPEEEPTIGGDDVLMGYVDGVPLYMRRDDAHSRDFGDMVVTLTQGEPRGFSLEGGYGLRFVLRAATLVTTDAPRGAGR